MPHYVPPLDVVQNIMKLISSTFLILALIASTVHAYSENERIKSVLNNYASERGHSDHAKIFLSETIDAEFYWVYWAEMQMLFSFPKNFHDGAIDKPSLIIRRPLVYPDDVREEGNKEMESSTYLVSFDWYRKRLTDIVPGGDILHFTTNPAQPDERGNSE